MAISFNEVPQGILVPGAYIEVDNSQAMQGASLMDYTALICAQKLEGGTAEPLKAYSVTSAERAAELFGRGSQAHLMARAFLENNSYTNLHMISVEDGEELTKATGTISVEGTATLGAPICLYIAGQKVSVPCATGTEAAALATAMAAAVNAEADLPVTAQASDTTVTLTARNGGTLGNDIDIRPAYYNETMPEGIKLTITAMSKGAGQPDVEELMAAWGDTWYHVIAWPWNDRSSLRTLEAELEDRWGPLRHIDGVAITSKAGTFSELQEFGSGEDKGNYAHISIVEACKTPTLPAVRAAAVAALVAYYGNNDPARPFQTLTISGDLAPAQEDRLTLEERNLLLKAGIATTVTDAGGNVTIERMVTNYLTTSTGAADTSYQDVNTLLTLSYLRYDFRSRILRKYPRHKLAGDTETIAPGQAIMTPKQGRAEAVAAFQDWQELGLVEDIAKFKAGLVCERNATDVNRLDWLITPDLVNQFRVAAVQIQFRL